MAELYKVMLVDDEFLVRMAFKNIIDWEQHGFTVIGSAMNEREAIALFREASPDVLICDIRIGSCNGLDIVKQLKTQKKDLKVIMLTHYDDFDYARNAFRYGANEYILKSDLSPQLLLSVLGRLFEQEPAAPEPEEAQAGDADALRDLLSQIVKGVPTPRIGRSGESRGVCSDLYLVAVGRFYFSSVVDMQLNMDYKEMESSLSDIIADHLRDRKIACALAFSQTSLVLLFRADAAAGESPFLATVVSAINQFKKSIKSIMDTDAIFGVSLVGSEPRQLGILYQEAEVANEYSYFDRSGVTDFTVVENSPNRLAYTAKLPVPSLKMLWRFVKDRDESGIRDYMEEIFGPFSLIGRIKSLRHVFNDFMGFIKLIAKEKGYDKNPAVGQAKLSYTVFDSLCGLESVRQYVTDLCLELLLNPLDANSKGYSHIVRSCIGFIKQNYASNITLGDMAEHTQVSKSYLSMLFKQETNVTISAYLTGYRIEKAKKLMLSTNDKMYEIASRVGFDNPYYFSKIFKEITGMTCKEFKNSNGILQDDD